MQTGDFFRVWDGESWLFGRCRENSPKWLTIQYYGFGNRACCFPHTKDNRQFIANFIANVEII